MSCYQPSSTGVAFILLIHIKKTANTKSLFFKLLSIHSVYFICFCFSAFVFVVPFACIISVILILI